MENNSDLSAESSNEPSFDPVQEEIIAYLQNKPISTETKLFSVLTLLKTYVPESYLAIQDCQQILGPPDASHRELTFEERMNPFSSLIEVSSEFVSLTNMDKANRYLEILAMQSINKNTIVKDCILLLSGEKVQSQTVQHLKNLLIGNELVKYSKDVSLLLIEQIMGKESNSSMKLQRTTTENSSDKAVTFNINLKSFLKFIFSLFKSDIFVQVEQFPESNSTKLFSILALLNAYVPKSYLLMKVCQQIFHSDGQIEEVFPFEQQMMPFLKVDRESRPRVSLIHSYIANLCVEELAKLGISRSSIANECIVWGHQAQPVMGKLIKDLLTKRKMVEHGKEKFSLLIEDICEKESVSEALFVLEKASEMFEDKFIYPQTTARLYYQKDINYDEAEEWAKKAINIDPKNSFTADTLGQVYKNWLMKRDKTSTNFIDKAKKAIKAFSNEEKKAKKECDDLTNMFNCRGHFGLIQVAKIISKKSKHCNPFKETLQSEVEEKFQFFEWYLSYSKQNSITVEPDYFWRDVASCYKEYTAKEAADSTSFPALLDCLNQGLFISKEKRAFGPGVTGKSQSDLEQIRYKLKGIYKNNVDDAKVAQRYILSNIILSNKIPHSSSHRLVRELQSILQRFLHCRSNHTEPEFYLLVLLLFWPEEPFEMDKERHNEALQEPDSSERLVLDQSPDLEECVTQMERAYDNLYSKYLRHRYLSPLFFLGKGSGLSRWIHKSALDAEVELIVKKELGDDPNKKLKRRKINDMWKSGSVWKLPQIKDILQPIQPKLIPSLLLQREAKVEVTVGGKKITARKDWKSVTLIQSSICYYLGFNIRGPVIFKGEAL